MDAIRSGLLRFADDVSLTFQQVARTFAFYSDGRDLIRLRETDGGLKGEFPDLSDEGWPAVVFPLPLDAAFQTACSSVLSRTAFFTSGLSPGELERQCTEAGLGVRRSSGHRWSARLGGEAVMKVSSPESSGGSASRRSAITIVQRRPPDAIVEAVRGRAARRPGSP